jgi:AraC-like DNA-binding protein
MPATGTTTFSDPGDYQRGFHSGDIDLVLIGSGIFKAQLTVVDLPRLKLLFVQESLPRIAYVSLPPDAVSFAFSTPAESTPIWGGLAMRSGDLMFHSIGERMHQRNSGISRRHVLLIDPEFFARSSKDFAGSEIVPPKVSRILRPTRTAAVELRRLHAKVCRLADTKSETLSHQEVARAIENDIIYVLIKCLLTNVVHGDTAPRRRRANVMDRFEDVLAAKFDQQMSIPELCADLGVAERSFRMCCFDVLGMSPSRYMRLRRLNLAHVALRHASPEAVNVSQIAQRYGFSELGRFAAAYRETFGELPSASLQRSSSGIRVSAEFA